MTPFLAQADLGQLPDALVKHFVIFIIGIAVAMSFVLCAVFAGLQYFQSRRAENKITRAEVTNNPLEVSKAAKRFNHEFWTHRCGELDRRLADHALQIQELRTEDAKLREADADIRQDVSGKFDQISRALGRIEGKLEGGTT